jgi:uncharacterized Ntn-hydrolase superfamily protein
MRALTSVAVPTALLLLASAAVAAPRATRPVATYSIVARDAATGELGVAVQSHWFSVGSVVPWAEPGVGAVATQSFVEVSYGPRGLAAMREGRTAEEALRALVAEDDGAAVRQVAFVDAAGRVAVHTGERCIPGAGHRTGAGFSVQANLMLTDDVPPAMATAFESASGPLAERMLAALEAAERAGGDVRGRQSAALLVVRGERGGKPGSERLIDLRVEDHERPLDELSRLLRLHRAYDKMNQGDEALAAGDLDRATARYAEAEALFPGNHELVFWHAVTLAGSGRVERSLPLFERAFRGHPAWTLVVPRLSSKGHLPAEPGLVERILAVAPSP